MDTDVQVATKPLSHHKDTPVLEHRDIHAPKMSHNQNNGSTHGNSPNCPNSSDESDIEENLVSTIHYNTISSLAALKDMLHINGEDTDCETFFQHYFLNHVNQLPSRNLVSPFVEKRRLSECLEEEDEEEEENKKEHSEKDGVSNSESDKSLSESSSSTQTVQELTGTTHKFLVTKTKEPKPSAKSSASTNSSAVTSPLDSDSLKTIDNSSVISSNDSLNIKDSKNDSTEPVIKEVKFLSAQVPPALRKRHYKQSNTVHFPATDPRKPSVYTIFNRTPLPSPHFDKRFFDSSLIEMRSLVSSSSTLEDSMEDIWIKRPEAEHKNELGSQPLPQTSSCDDTDQVRPRSGTWGAGKSHDARTKDAKHRHQKEGSGGGHGSGSSGSRSGSTSRSSSQERRKSGDDTSSPSRHRGPAASVLDAFRPRSKSDASKKKSGTLMAHMKSAMQHTGLMHMHHRAKVAKDGSAHPVSKGEASGPGGSSHTQYYHTVTAGATSHSRSPMTKVMDIFRNRSHATVTGDEKMRKKLHEKIAQQQQQKESVNLRRASLDPQARRQSLGNVIPHRASDAFLDPHHAAILFRDSRGLPVADPFLDNFSISDLEGDESQIFVKFFKFHKCYDLIPTSAKLVVFDTQLLVKKAFFALVYNGVRAAPLWDSERQQFVGMLTITDFIKILQMNYTSPTATMEELEEHKLDTWRKVLKGNGAPSLIYISPDASLFDAIKTLIQNKIHRLPVIDPDTGNVLYILTHKRILRFLFIYIKELPKPSYMNKTIRELKIGTYDNIETATAETSIIVALKKFVERRVSALPIIDPDGKLVDIYAKFDVINLAAEKTYNNLDVTLKKANEHRNEWFEGVHKCKLDDTLYSTMEKINRAEVHRLVIVDDEEKVIGIISLSDILHYLVLRPGGEPDQTTQTNGITRTHKTSISQSISDSDIAETELEHAIPEEDVIDLNDDPLDEHETIPEEQTTPKIKIPENIIETAETNDDSPPSTPTQLETPKLTDNVGFREVTVSGGE